MDKHGNAIGSVVKKTGVSITQQQNNAAIAKHSEQADLFAGRYERLQAEVYRSCFAYSRYRLNGWLERFLPERAEGLSLLDVGCGTGHHLRELRDRGFEAAGMDGSAEMLEHARELNPGSDIQQADVNQLPYDDGSFDYAVSIEVLRYLADPQTAIREMARVLTPGGVCLVTAAPVWNANGYWLVNRAAGVLPVKKLVRLQQYFTTSRRLRRQFAAAGFASVEVHGVYTGPINWLERLARPLLPMGLKCWEPFDRRLADLPLLREFSNMFLVRAVRGS